MGRTLFLLQSRDGLTDGVHFNIRLEEDRLAALVVVGVSPDGTKELVTIEDGYPESTESRLGIGVLEAALHAPEPELIKDPLGDFGVRLGTLPGTLEESIGDRGANVLRVESAPLVGKCGWRGGGSSQPR